jgi:phosphoribosyl-AMP cyclohydrolase
MWVGNIPSISYIDVYAKLNWLEIKWTQKCAVQKASVDVNISYYYLKKKKKSWTQGPGFFLIKN